jgi:hypothetical protein
MSPLTGNPALYNWLTPVLDSFKFAIRILPNHSNLQISGSDIFSHLSFAIDYSV